MNYDIGLSMKFCDRRPQYQEVSTGNFQRLPETTYSIGTREVSETWLLLDSSVNMEDLNLRRLEILTASQ